MDQVIRLSEHSHQRVKLPSTYSLIIQHCWSPSMANSRNYNIFDYLLFENPLSRNCRFRTTFTDQISVIQSCKVRISRATYYNSGDPQIRVVIHARMSDYSSRDQLTTPGLAGSAGFCPSWPLGTRAGCSSLMTREAEQSLPTSSARAPCRREFHPLAATNWTFFRWARYAAERHVTRNVNKVNRESQNRNYKGSLPTSRKNAIREDCDASGDNSTTRETRNSWQTKAKEFVWNWTGSVNEATMSKRRRGSVLNVRQSLFIVLN